MVIVLGYYRVTKPVRLASIGLGWWGNELTLAARRAGARIVSCFARSPGTREEFAKTHGCAAAESLEGLFANPEVEGVIVATPHSTHTSIVEAAASAGKHVFVEKPLALSYREAKQSVDAAARAGIVLQVGHNRRRQPAIRTLKAMIEDGDLGMIHHVEANLSYPKGQRPRPGWRGDPAEIPAGGMTGLGVHMIDNLLYLVGGVERLAAFSKQILGANRLDDATTVMLEFSSGPLGLIGTSTVIPDRATVAVFGTEGSAWSERDGARFFLQDVDEPERTELPIDWMDTLQDELAEFLRCVREGGTPEVGGFEGLQVVQVLDAVLTSVRESSVVDVDAIEGV